MANGMIAGIYEAWCAVRDSNGYGVGSNATPDTKTPNSVYSAYRLKYPVRYEGPQPTREQAIRRGGMANRNRRDLGVSDFGNFNFVMDAFDETFHALISASLLDTTTMTGWTTTSFNANVATLPRMILGLVLGFTDENGVDKYMTTIYNNVQIRPKTPGSSQDGGVNPNPLEYEVLPDVSTRHASGRPYSAMALGVRDNSDIASQHIYNYPLYLVDWVANGAATTFTLPFKPVTSDATAVATNSITKNGATQTVTSVNTSSGLVTISAAGSSGDIFQVLYPTAFL